jgi:hypothetical protein
MRQKRAKAYKRLMNLYCQTFGFRQPFQVLGMWFPSSFTPPLLIIPEIPVCEDFMLELSNKQLDVAKQLTNCVQGECKPSKLTSIHEVEWPTAHSVCSDHTMLNGGFVQAWEGTSSHHRSGQKL